MERYLGAFQNAFVGYAEYLWAEVTTPHLHNYFYYLIGVSLLFFLWEQAAPWRKSQPRIRSGFWLDAFYMFFNFFLFSLIGYHALSTVVSIAFDNALFGVENLALFEIHDWPVWTQLLTMFFLRDFVQYWIHRGLHRSPLLWRFHKLHHSTRQMGFAAHLRFHPGETIVYRVLEYVPLGLVGFGIDQFFIVYAFSTAVGHFNHSNVRFPMGPLRFVFNTPQMHIWHHMKEFPKGTSGVNFGQTLSVWDYLFGTAHWPSDGRDIELGFREVETYPTGFLGQLIKPFR